MKLSSLSVPCVAVAISAVLSACGGQPAPTTALPAPTEVAALDTPPPAYPIALACEGIGGVSTLKVTVGADGNTSAISVVKSSGNAGLDEAAQAAVKGWKFKPATRGGQAAPTTIQVPVNFTPPAERPNECFALDSQTRSQ
jgi:protein TonB